MSRTLPIGKQKKRGPTQYYERSVYMEGDEIRRLHILAGEGKPVKEATYLLMPGLDDDSNIYEISLLFTKAQANKIDKAYEQFDEMFTEKTAKFSKVSGKMIADALLADQADFEEELEAYEFDDDEIEQIIDVVEELQSEGATKAEMIQSLDDLLEELGEIKIDGSGVRGKKRYAVSSFSAAQMKKMHGRGIFSDITKGLTAVAAEAANSFAPGLGSALKVPVDLALDAIDKAITGKGMMTEKDLRKLKKILKKKKGGQMRVKRRPLARSKKAPVRRIRRRPVGRMRI